MGAYTRDFIDPYWVRTIIAVQDGMGVLVYADPEAEQLLLSGADDFGVGCVETRPWSDLSNGIHVVTWDVRTVYDGMTGDYDVDVEPREKRPVTSAELLAVKRGEWVWLTHA